MSSNKTKRVFVAMSGGVDSSVTALLLKQAGYDVTGVHMICWEGCENNQDKRDAMQVCAELDIPFLALDFRREYKANVFNYMIQEYKSGRTPNPDVICNKKIKFGIFLERALGAGADFIATGHYVRLTKNVLELRAAKDPSKDQSYFLWTLTQEQLKYCLFPIGDYLKSEVRELARKFNLPTSDKKDSQGLCFVGNIDFGEFLRNAVDTKQGNVIKKDGTKIGEHDGAQFYTIGQRHGLNIGGSREPLYITEKDVKTNMITVAEGKNDPTLFCSELNIESVHWISSVAPTFPFQCLARIRYRQSLQKCSVFKDSHVIFENPQRAVAPGQSIVFYLPTEALAQEGDGDTMLGGGIIS